MSIFFNIYFWFIGHIICVSSAAFLKNPAMRLVNQWFGDKETDIVTSICTIPLPLGIFISQIMMVLIFDSNDKDPQNK